MFIRFLWNRKRVEEQSIWFLREPPHPFWWWLKVRSLDLYYWLRRLEVYTWMLVEFTRGICMTKCQVFSGWGGPPLRSLHQSMRHGVLWWSNGFSDDSVKVELFRCEHSDSFYLFIFFFFVFDETRLHLEDLYVRLSFYGVWIDFHIVIPKDYSMKQTFVTKKKK